MSLAQRLAAPPAPRGSVTVLDRWLESLTETDRAAVLTALTDPAWRHVDLQAELEAEGAPKIADTTFGAWRRRKGFSR